MMLSEIFSRSIIRRRYRDVELMLTSASFQASIDNLAMVDDHQASLPWTAADGGVGDAVTVEGGDLFIAPGVWRFNYGLDSGGVNNTGVSFRPYFTFSDGGGFSGDEATVGSDVRDYIVDLGGPLRLKLEASIYNEAGGGDFSGGSCWLNATRIAPPPGEYQVLIEAP